MGGKTRTNLILLMITGYCGLSWITMRLDYFTVGGESSVTRQFVHLLFTSLCLLMLVLWKGRSIEGFIARLSALPIREGIAPFAVAAILVYSMSVFPRSRATLHGISWGLMESTRSLVQGLFLGTATVGLALALLMNARAVVAGLVRLSEKVIFRSRRRAFLAGVMLLIFVEINAISFFQFHHVPIFPEEVNNIFQAKIFASGRLYAPPPQYAQFFDFSNFFIGDKWYAEIAPGFPLLLALGVPLHAMWVINPILAALCAMLIYLVALRMYDETIARGSALLALVSPFLLLLSSVHLSHISTTFFFLLFLFFFLGGIEDSRGSRFLLAGLALGAMALTRPLTAAAASAPWAAYMLWLVIRRKLRFTSILALACGLSAPLAFLAAYNFVIIGDPLILDYAAVYAERFGGLPHVSIFRGYSNAPLRALVNLNSGLFRFNAYLLGWPLPALLFAMIPFALPSKNKWDYLLLASMLVVPLAYCFCYYQDFQMGPRYYFAVIPAAVILAARGLSLTPGLWSRLTGRMDDSHLAPQFLAALICISVIYSSVLFLPGRLSYYDISSDVHQGLPSPIWRHIEANEVSNAVVFIDELGLGLAYGSGLWRNDPELKGDIIYARDRGKKNVRLMRQYHGRKYYQYVAVTDSFKEVFPAGELCTTSTSLQQ